MIQAVVLFLVAMLALAVYGKLKRGNPKISSGKCPRCGRHRIGKGPCACGKGA
ncbi:hypothetical protein ACRDNQ_11430 [Palleronia sp. KMU-117]|uniref:hypothetical protein n=1 Tax=Palleronia sp. KMU-117 TaxID=3434108 RepID=UPI003D75A077